MDREEDEHTSALSSRAKLENDALRDAYDQVFAALREEDPTSALRAAAIAIAGGAAGVGAKAEKGGGLGRTLVETVFISVCEDLAEQGREEESSLVAYVLDMIAEW